MSTAAVRADAKSRREVKTSTKASTRQKGRVSRLHASEKNDSSPMRVVETIHKGILSGRYVPGQKLIEADITTLLNISRGPVREAFKQLAAEGVVELTRHRGASIRAMTRRETRDLLEVMEVVTVLIARNAAKAVAQKADARLVRDAFKWLESFSDPSVAGENLGFLEQRSHFYDVLIAIGGNTQVRSIMPMMRIHLLRLQVQPFFSREDWQDRVNEYAAITQAVLEGDETAAQRTMRQHFRRMEQRVSQLPDEAFSTPDA
jgi:DNA-binding GntR family transcriptional regulator